MAPASLRFQMLEIPMFKALTPYVREKAFKGTDYLMLTAMAMEAESGGEIHSRVAHVAEELGFTENKAFLCLKRLKQLDLIRRGMSKRRGAFWMVNPEFFYAGARNKQDAAIELYKTLEGPCKAA